MKRSGFTLVELLVVISIIALLAAILLPVLKRARLTAQAANCRSNMQQIGLAMEMYSNEYNEYICWATDSTNGHKDWYHWPGDTGSGTMASYTYDWPELYTPYTETGDVFMDPGLTRWTISGYTQCGMTSERRDSYRSDYEINWFCLTGQHNQVKYAASTVAMQCGRFGYDTAWAFMPNWTNTAELGSGTSASAPFGFSTSVDGGPKTVPGNDANGKNWWTDYRLPGLERGNLVHKGGLNFLFLDGHVAWLAPAAKGRDWHLASSERHWNLNRDYLVVEAEE